MTIAIVLTPYITNDRGNNIPQVAVAYPLAAWVDVTQTPTEEIVPDPNLVAIRLTCTNETFELIQADPAYYILETEQ